MSARKHFLFVVFTDPVVVGALQFLGSVMDSGNLSIKPHLTIQGPFEEKVDLDRIRVVKKNLEDDIFFIGNPGLFETPNGVALYLSVSSKNLRKVWNKPDYPIEKYGFNPHITIYDGPDLRKVKAAFDFLVKNRIELLCRDFEIAQYVPKQFDMFPVEGAKGDVDAIGKLMTRGSLGSSFRARFMAAVNSDS
jgi:hypothetical protein